MSLSKNGEKSPEIGRKLLEPKIVIIFLSIILNTPHMLKKWSKPHAIHKKDAIINTQFVSCYSMLL